MSVKCRQSKYRDLEILSRLPVYSVGHCYPEDSCFFCLGTSMWRVSGLAPNVPGLGMFALGMLVQVIAALDAINLPAHTRTDESWNSLSYVLLTWDFTRPLGLLRWGKKRPGAQQLRG